MGERRPPRPDAHDSALETAVRELADRTARVLGAQGKLRKLLEASLGVVEELDLDHVLTRIVEAAVSLVDARYGALGVIGSDGRLERFIHVGMPASQVSAIGHPPEGRGLLGAVIDSGSIVRLTNLADDPRSAGFPEHHPPMTAFLGVPIRIGDRVYGNLYLTNKDGAFTEDDEELVASLAVTAGIAIHNADLFAQARHRQQLTAALSQTTTALLSPDTTDVLDIVARHVECVVAADLVTVTVPGPRGGDVRVAAAHGDDAPLIRDVVFPAADTLAGQAINTGIVTRSEDGAGHSYLDGRLRLGPVLAVPLTVEDEAIGALCIARHDHGRPFTAEETALVTEFAGQAGIAVALAWARLDRQRLEMVEDRTRIARDLHDLVIQRLFVTGLGLQALAATRPELGDDIEPHIEQIDGAIADIRTAIFTLNTRSGRTRGRLRHRLLDVVNEASSGLAQPPRLSFGGPLDLLVTGTLADDVVAVVRELLANVARHAAAHHVTVAVEATEGQLTVTVTDDGRGLPPGGRRASGTRHLAQRAGDRGGTFTLGAVEPTGTRAQWQVPFDPGSEQSS